MGAPSRNSSLIEIPAFSPFLTAADGMTRPHIRTKGKRELGILCSWQLNGLLTNFSQKCTTGLSMTVQGIWLLLSPVNVDMDSSGISGKK